MNKNLDVELKIIQSLIDSGNKLLKNNQLAQGRKILLDAISYTAHVAESLDKQNPTKYKLLIDAALMAYQCEKYHLAQVIISEALNGSPQKKEYNKLIAFQSIIESEIKNSILL